MLNIARNHYLREKIGGVDLFQMATTPNRFIDEPQERYPQGIHFTVKSMVLKRMFTSGWTKSVNMELQTKSKFVIVCALDRFCTQHIDKYTITNSTIFS